MCIRDRDNTSPEVAVSILYNLISLKNKINRKNDNYKDIKQFLDYYINFIKSANYGYDNFNYEKIEKLLLLLNPAEQVTLLQYAISITYRELPEYDREWFLERKYQAEIDSIINSKDYKFYPKALFLFCGQSIKRVFLTLGVFFLFISLILLPAPIKCLVLFKLSYENYSSNFIFNHLLNILSLFADIDNDLVIEPINWIGLFLSLIHI